MSAYSATILANNPLRYYRLGESSGIVAHDLGSGGQNGTLHGGITLAQPGLIVGDSDTAMLFNGSTGYISFVDTGLSSGASPWSLECWVNFSSFTDYPIPLFYGSTSTNGSALLWVNAANNTANIGFTNAGNAQGPVLALNTTYHLMGTYDGMTLRIYVNGALSGSTATTGNIVLNAGSVGSQLGASEFAAGIIDEPAIYGYALTGSQVALDYQAGTAQHLLSNTWLTRDMQTTWKTRQ